MNATGKSNNDSVETSVFEKLRKSKEKGEVATLTRNDVELLYKVLGKELESAEAEIMALNMGQEFASRWVEKWWKQRQKNKCQFSTCQELREATAAAVAKFVKGKPVNLFPLIREVALEALDTGNDNCYRELATNGTTTTVRVRELLEFRELLWVAERAVGVVQLFRFPLP